MKVAFDVDVIKHLSITGMIRQVSEWDYKYIQQSQHPRINPFCKHPRASRALMSEYKRALNQYGVELPSFIANPPDVNATIHQHRGIGKGKVDFSRIT